MLLEVIRGCMFSGKTEELLRRLNRLRYARQKGALYKPVLDDRYSVDSVMTHDWKVFPSKPITFPQEILEDKPLVDVVAVDEVMFFGFQGLTDIIEVFERLISLYNRIIVTGLDTDFRGEPVRVIADLLAMCDEDVHLKAVCTVCGEEATRTQRIKEDGRPAHYEDSLIVVGGEEEYEARCRKHHEVPGKGVYNRI